MVTQAPFCNCHPYLGPGLPDHERNHFYLFKSSCKSFVSFVSRFLGEIAELVKETGGSDAATQCHVKH